MSLVNMLALLAHMARHQSSVLHGSSVASIVKSSISSAVRQLSGQDMMASFAARQPCHSYHTASSETQPHGHTVSPAPNTRGQQQSISPTRFTSIHSRSNSSSDVPLSSRWGFTRYSTAAQAVQSSSVESAQGPSSSSDESQTVNYPIDMHSVQATQSQLDLVYNLKLKGYITHPRVEAILSFVDRYDYAHAHGIRGNDAVVYKDVPVELGYGQSILPPSQQAVVLEGLISKLEPGCRVLDIGTGSGYMAACFANLVWPDGSVVSLERKEQLQEQARFNVAIVQLPLLYEEGGNLLIKHANALEEGVLDEYEPFDAIHISAAVDIIPDFLLDKLKPGGILVAPVGPPAEIQVLVFAHKAEDGSMSYHKSHAVKVMPLTPPAADVVW